MLQQFSPNMLKTFKECPKKFQFKYIKNISMPVNDEIFETGKNIHALASYYLKKQDVSNLEKVLDENEKALWEYLKNTEYIKYETINTEYNLTFKLGSYFFGGRLDALVYDGEKYYILDYKTGCAPVNAKFDFQTIVYILAVKNYFNTDNIEFVYLDLKNKKSVNIIYDNDLKYEYENSLTEIANKINQGIFIKNVNVCPCEYKILCF